MKSSSYWMAVILIRMEVKLPVFPSVRPIARRIELLTPFHCPKLTRYWWIDGGLQLHKFQIPSSLNWHLSGVRYISSLIDVSEIYNSQVVVMVTQIQELSY